MTERVFKIKWDDELGPMWLNQDNLMRCLVNTCKNTDFTVTDVTNKPEDCMVAGADLCVLGPSVHIASKETADLPIVNLPDGYVEALQERNSREFRSLIEGSWVEESKDPSPLSISGRPVDGNSLLFRQYRKLPVVIEAVQIHAPFRVETLEGAHMGSPGDFLIRGIAGELYPCKPDIFMKTYEQVDPPMDLKLGYESNSPLLGIGNVQKKLLHIEQPMPVPGRAPVGPVVREMFEGILREQEEKGFEKYGTRLMTFNGRNPILDAMAEAVDNLQYLTQAYMELEEAQRCSLEEASSDGA